MVIFFFTCFYLDKILDVLKFIGIKDTAYNVQKAKVFDAITGRNFRYER